MLADGPYVAVLGAALQFERWHDRMWHVLRALSEQNPAVTIALAHAVGGLRPPADGFEEVERVSGMAYGMHTAYAEPAMLRVKHEVH